MVAMPPNVAQAHVATDQLRDCIPTGLSIIGRCDEDRTFDVGLRVIGFGIDAALSSMEDHWLGINSEEWGLDPQREPRPDRFRNPDVPVTFDDAHEEYAFDDRLREVIERRHREPFQTRDARHRGRVNRLRERKASNMYFLASLDRRALAESGRQRLSVSTKGEASEHGDPLEFPRQNARREILDPVPEWPMLLGLLDRQAIKDDGTTRILSREAAARALDVAVDAQGFTCLPPLESHYLLSRVLVRALGSWISYLAAIWHEGYAMEPSGNDEFARRVPELDALLEELGKDSYQGGAARSW